jgi:hypothetical protein
VGNVRPRRDAQLVKCRERQLNLELRAGRADDLELLPGRVLDVVQQRALADTRLSAEHEHTTLALLRRTDEREEVVDLVVAADEPTNGRRGHGRTLWGCRRGEAADAPHPLGGSGDRSVLRRGRRSRSTRVVA